MEIIFKPGTEKERKMNLPERLGNKLIAMKMAKKARKEKVQVEEKEVKSKKSKEK